ncbi:RagB/SusD family nutrient uptake outer membrane protein [Flagellimonas eckloniae]|uniref:Carbohydrate-binding protein SusD n=1 Tax=Flagellimonas eckloniae TaxID=346185 RepID=A0A0Q1BH70_9FLAO|nr:RagB/SusD family nutrient uptake outer membrane protein [Allomuricauda eckloniae]KQC29818.1 hypothetical protein AAY42_07935 [Allomuricauda eckloniae]
MKNITILLSVFAGILLSSCDDVLDVKPENYLFEEQLVTDDKSAQTSLVGVYTQLNGTYIHQFAEITTPLMDGSVIPGSTAAYYNEAASNGFEPSSGIINNIYENIYAVANSANATIKNVSGNTLVSEAESKRILGEAYFMRAFGHFEVLRLFGQFYDVSSAYGIVLKKELSTVANSQIARSSVQESYDFIVSDLDESIARNVIFSQNYYASSTTAKAYKANVLLYMGGEANYTEAIGLVDEVIASGEVTLEPNFEDIFSNGEANSEVIFTRVAAEGQSSKFSFYYQTAIKASDWIKDYLLDDPRAPYSYDDSNNRVKKIYTSEIGGGPRNFMRLAEVYLIKAECQARLNQLTEAEATLNIIRNRAYSGAAPALIYTTQQELLDLVFDEYVKELCFETGTVLSAAIRFGKLEEIKVDVTSPDQYILPIPVSELEANLVFGAQNPGYE